MNQKYIDDLWIGVEKAAREQDFEQFCFQTAKLFLFLQESLEKEIQIGEEPCP